MVALSGFIGLSALRAEADLGALHGRITDLAGQGIGGVAVVIDELGHVALSEHDGSYRLLRVASGTWSVSFSLSDATLVESAVTVEAGRSTRLDKSVDWQLHFAETMTVTSASRRRERIVDAPAAVTLVSTGEIERDASAGQVPKLLEQTPGLELTQSGLYDFNLNTRGFNGPLTRRIAVLIDGRDPSIPFLGAQEWSALSLPLDDIESLEMVRGPSAALYGANASSGVVNVVTKAPRESVGGILRWTAGGLSTTNLDFRWAGELFGGWYGKLLAGYRTSDTFTVSRQGAAEYSVPCSPSVLGPCLPQEVVDPAGEVEIRAGALRFDKEFGERFALTLETGTASVEGVTLLTNLGRVAIFEADRPWARIHLNHPRWNVSVNYNRRDAPVQTVLASGRDLVLDSRKVTLEARGNHDFGDRARLVVGGSYRVESIDTLDPRRGVQTLLFEAVSDEAAALYSQLDWNLTKRLKLVLAGRWDHSETFYDSELSPKAALVWNVSANHTLRLSYNEAFQAPNYAEKLAQADVAPALPLQSFETFCAPFGISCGFAGPSTRLLAVGNQDLGIEQVRAFEIGYHGLLGQRVFLTVDYYRSDNKNFITDLLPELTTPLGDINRSFGPYRPPADLPATTSGQLLAELRGTLGTLFPFLTNNIDGDPFLALLTYGSFGQVETQGVDLAVRYSWHQRWSLSASYSFFDFDLVDSLPGLDQVLSPNAPEHQLRAGLSYVGERLDVSLAGRWVDGFFWASGPFAGMVEPFATFDLYAGYRFSDRLSFAVDVANLFDDEHYEAFGGALLGRRALGSVTLSW